ncbi:hypothetical protein [Streptomyces virginiae]|uniref:hypothetical protein n=1 Tax=Streptomyces virginiae TaxID=1961 RepID=UPI0022500872|nr:hypothetical protein [Streptomyces virginiae]MCX5174011.1 hypothetical protein [Streptomyces virginiae]
MSTPTNGPEHTRRIPARPGYGALSADLQARADRGLARFLGRQDMEQESTDGGEA